MESNLTRRNFVAGTAAAALAAAGIASSAKVASAEETEETEEAAGSSEDSTSWDKECEVLVCGYGAGGASCAIEAADNGAQVLIIEKGSLPGGSMARCLGVIVGAGSQVQEELGIEDSADGLYNYIQAVVNKSMNICPDEIIRTYADESGANIDWLSDLCEEYCGCELFDVTDENCMYGYDAFYSSYGVSDDPEMAVDRAHWAHSYDGGVATGPELFDPMRLCIEAKQEEGAIEVEFNTALKEFIVDDSGAVIGAVATTDDGEIRIKASKGVMMATGGFAESESMRMRFCQDAVDYVNQACPECEGDGIQAAMKIGADLYGMCNFVGLEGSVTYQYATKYNDVYRSWLDMDEETGAMVCPAHSINETCGGVRINSSAQVLDVDGNIIPHLYASGNDVGVIVTGSNYPGCGTFTSFAICYGRIAGRKLAAEEEGVNEEVDADPFTSDDVVIYETDEEETGEEDEFADATYADGTYEGVGSGRGGDINITIEIEDGVISVVELTHENETEGFGGAEAIEDGTFASQIEEAQGVDIDGVSGCTLTTNGVIEALTDALEQAIVDDEEESAEETEEE